MARDRLRARRCGQRLRRAISRVSLNRQDRAAWLLACEWRKRGVEFLDPGAAGKVHLEDFARRVNAHAEDNTETKRGMPHSVARFVRGFCGTWRSRDARLVR